MCYRHSDACVTLQVPHETLCSVLKLAESLLKDAGFPPPASDQASDAVWGAGGSDSGKRLVGGNGPVASFSVAMRSLHVIKRVVGGVGGGAGAGGAGVGGDNDDGVEVEEEQEQDEDEGQGRRMRREEEGGGGGTRRGEEE